MTTVFITGGGRGIGLALAEVYAAAGATVIRGLRDPTSAGKPDLGEVLPLDVGDDRSVAALGAELEGRPIDILINNAGVIGPRRQTTDDMDYGGFLETLNINTLGPLRVTQALLPNLRGARPAGKVVIISSRMGALSSSSSDHLAYRTSKAGVNKVAQALASDLQSHGIAVASMHPGWVRTDMGGSSADIDVATSARGIKSVTDRLTVQTTGRFWNYDGAQLAW